MMQINGTPQTEFKETKIGLIPVEWEICPLQQLGIDFHGGATPSRKKKEYWSGDIAWVTSAYLDDKLYLDVCADYITVQGLNNASTRIVPKGNLLIGSRVGVGKVVINAIDVAISQDLTAMLVDLSKASPQYLAYAIRSDEIQQRILSSARGTTIKGIPRTDLLAIPIPLPPLPEQQRIAAVLNAIQDEIAVQEDILRELREFKRSTMDRLFTYGTGESPAETKMTEIGEFPVHWDDFLLNEVADLKYGYQTSIPKTPPQSGVDIISTAEIKNEGYLDLVKIRKVGIDVADVAQYLVRKDDVLFNWRNSQEHVGKTALVTVDLLEPTIYASFIVRIRPTNHVSHQYIHYLLSFLRDRGVFFERSRRAVNQANFNANQLGNLEIPIPSSSEQETIVDLLQGIDEKIAVEEDRKAALQDFFRTMLQQLMTGQIRLLSDEGLEGFLDDKG